MKSSTKKFLAGLVVILFIFSMLGSISVHSFLQHQHRNKEIVLQQNLWSLRRAIDFYTADKEKSPKSLQDLVDAGYLRELPTDPITKSNQTWVVKNAEKSESSPEGGIIDVHSGAPGADASGKPYNQY